MQPRTTASCTYAVCYHRVVTDYNPLYFHHFLFHAKEGTLTALLDYHSALPTAEMSSYTHPPTHTLTLSFVNILTPCLLMVMETDSVSPTLYRGEMQANYGQSSNHHLIIGAAGPLEASQDYFASLPGLHDPKLYMEYYCVLWNLQQLVYQVTVFHCTHDYACQ